MTKPMTAANAMARRMIPTMEGDFLRLNMIFSFRVIRNRRVARG
jgi:hypothetical protein